VLETHILEEVSAPETPGSPGRSFIPFIGESVGDPQSNTCIFRFTTFIEGATYIFFIINS
jgi:hypothetical protein